MVHTNSLAPKENRVAWSIYAGLLTFLILYIILTIIYASQEVSDNVKYFVLLCGPAFVSLISYVYLRKFHHRLSQDNQACTDQLKEIYTRIND